MSLWSNRRNSPREIDPSVTPPVSPPSPFLLYFILFKVSKMKDQLCVQTANTSEEMFEYYVNTVQIMDMMRDAIVKLRRTMKDVIRTELYAVDREYIVGIGVLSIL